MEFQKTNNIAALEEEGKSAGIYLANLNLELAKLKLDRQLLRDGLSPFGNTSTNSANHPATAGGTAPETNAVTATSEDGLAANLISAARRRGFEEGPARSGCSQKRKGGKGEDSE